MRNLLKLFFLSLLISSCSEHNKANNDYLISNTNIVDIEKGVIIPHQFVRITDERIIKISDSNLNVSGSIQVVDGSGKYLIPGLWDMHVHYCWNYPASNPLLIANGITGVREMFGDMDTIKSIRNAANKKMLFAPEIISSGPIIDGVPAIWPGSDTISNPNQAKDIVSKQIAQGVDFLKVYSMLTKENYFAIAKEANARNIPFSGHIPDDVTIWEAIKAKQRSFEHLYGLLEGCTKYPYKLALYKKPSFPFTQKMLFLKETFDEVKFDSLLNELAVSDSWICPTLIMLRAMGHSKDTIFTNDKRIKYLPTYMTSNWKESENYNTPYIELSGIQFEFQKSLIGKMQHAGVKIIAGTDFPNPYCFPGFSLHDELSLMVEGGMTPLEALKSATLNPALFLNKKKEYGTVAAGKFASLILLNKNPLENINNTKEIYAVFLKGNYFDRTSLDKLLKNAALAAVNQ